MKDRVSFTIHCDLMLAERIKNAAHASDRSSVAAFIISGLEAGLIDFERQHNHGEPFPPRPTLAEKIGGASC
ncbi:MAG: hypothetical protein JNM56_35580 [Planctomycetia bacterium]|nr:hypothetical protein [Planctomycetia bacterium]